MLNVQKPTSDILKKSGAEITERQISKAKTSKMSGIIINYKYVVLCILIQRMNYLWWKLFLDIIFFVFF